ncbi:hypothetical protein Ahu01nite_079620 [Winogradskya humida]|uniref:Uncharacterized protein n=1 Tax=Winogradskya humida TaxID=113566 RepID=A0ABQ4A1X4_9ACTN|nr:hypothetical protein Ahu01nite_079620 [Actinoplanes humidus]
MGVPPRQHPHQDLHACTHRISNGTPITAAQLHRVAGTTTRPPSRRPSKEKTTDNAISVTDPYLSSPAVRHCDARGTPARTRPAMVLITDPHRGWHHNEDASRPTHLPAQGTAGDEGHLYRVGDLFDADRTSWPQGSHLWLDSDGDTRLAIFLTDTGRREMSAVESGTPCFGWTEQDVNGFLLFKYGDSPWNDDPFSPAPDPSLLSRYRAALIAGRSCSWCTPTPGAAPRCGWSPDRPTSSTTSSIRCTGSRPVRTARPKRRPPCRASTAAIPTARRCTASSALCHPRPRAQADNAMTALIDSRHHRSLIEELDPGGQAIPAARPATPSSMQQQPRRLHVAHTCSEQTPERLEPLAEGPKVSPPRPGAQTPAEHLGPHRLALLDAKIF